MAVNPIPEGYPRVSPYLAVQGGAAAIDWYCDVFGAKERMRMPMPDGTVAHAELDFGDSLIMLADETEGMNTSPKTVGGTPVVLSMYVADVDAVVAKAVEAGATPLRPVEDQFYGDRTGVVEDPFGHQWHLATHVEDVSEEDMEKRMAAQMGGA